MKNMKKENKNPWGIKNIPYETPIAQFVDTLVEVAKKNGSKDYVQTSQDWETIQYIYKGWTILYPKTSNDFLKAMKEWRLRNGRGFSKEGNAMIQHRLEVPSPLFAMVKTIFPKQTWDRKFVAKFISELPAFRATESGK